MFNVRKVNSDNERIYNCISCGETSTSMQIESMYEITMPETKIYICENCVKELKEIIINM